ncbi:hypothetical protein [Solibacillus isronensis]|uniref:hypothetical protein n=1 Tax=Solibacillus isronensis TaxID=412383 RepID=UPI0039A2A638
MHNNVNLNDDELSVILTALKMTILGCDKHILMHGESSLDFATKQAHEEMKALEQRLNKEYF